MAAAQLMKGSAIRLILRREAAVLLLVFLLYLILGTLLPLTYHKKPSAETAAAFSAGSFYGEAGDTAERVACIDDPEDALQKRIQVIGTAEKELFYCAYEFHADESGQDVLAALLNAADRGVRVRVLIDGLTGTAKTRSSAAFKALAAHENAEIRIYNPINVLLPWKAQLRMHDKYVIADDHTYLLGGRNTFDLFLGSTGEKKNIDRELLVYTASPAENDSIRQLKAYSEKIWAEKCCKPFTNSGKKTAAAAEELRARYRQLPAGYLAAPDWPAETYAAEKISLIAGETAPVNKEPKVWYALSGLMAQGKEVLIETPYIILSADMQKDLQAICRSADKVEILLNAVENGANPFGCTDYLNQRKNIWSTGAAVYEFSGENSLHTKTVLIDQELSIVGSFNMDMRSAYLDTELMLAVDCPELNAELRRDAAAKQESSRCRADGTYLYGENYLHKEMSLPKKLIYQLLRIVIIPIRHLL